MGLSCEWERSEDVSGAIVLTCNYDVEEEKKIVMSKRVSLPGEKSPSWDRTVISTMVNCLHL